MSYTPSDYSPPARMPALLEARERAIALLTDRFADETLSEAEFEARLSWLSAADSAARIEDLVADLSLPRTPATGTLTGAGYGPRPAAEERLVAIMSSTARTGQWTMPLRLALRAVMSEVELDLRFANLPPLGEIDLRAIMANVRIIVPPEMSVECRVSPFMGTVKNSAGESAWPGYGAPRLVVAGSCVMAEVRIDVLPRLR